MKRAMFIRTAQFGSGDALLYKLSDPVKFCGDQKTNNVVVSAATANGMKRATVFPANEDGVVLSFESVAETKHTLDHEAPLIELGYEVM